MLLAARVKNGRPDLVLLIPERLELRLHLPAETVSCLITKTACWLFFSAQLNRFS
jgi:hypothetical protein